MHFKSVACNEPKSGGFASRLTFKGDTFLLESFHRQDEENNLPEEVVVGVDFVLSIWHLTGPMQCLKVRFVGLFVQIAYCPTPCCPIHDPLRKIILLKQVQPAIIITDPQLPIQALPLAIPKPAFSARRASTTNLIKLPASILIGVIRFQNLTAVTTGHYLLQIVVPPLYLLLCLLGRQEPVWGCIPLLRQMIRFGPSRLGQQRQRNEDPNLKMSLH